jgi:ferric-dicitrate binding protein FerR (iron transport regulator)
VAARVIEVKGTAVAGQGANASRSLVAGAAVYVDEEVVTQAGAHVVLAFRDGTRITLAPESRLAVLRFNYDDANPQKGAARLKLVSGSAQVWTGRLAKLGTDAFLFDTRLGTIHPQGTGFTVGDADKGKDEVLVVNTWDGNVIIQTATDRIEVKKTDSVAISIVDGKIVLLNNPPATLLDANLPRPDGVNVDPSTFGQTREGVENGLYVWVRDGLVTMDKDNRTVEVQAGSAALATRERLSVLDIVPNFMRFDTTPRPIPGGATFQIPYFRARDGSIVGMCKP